MKSLEHKSVSLPKCVAVTLQKYRYMGLSKMSLKKVRSSGSLTNNDDIIKSGHLKKLKEAPLHQRAEGMAQEALRMLDRRTMKKKFFVLRRETGPESPARLEYYDSEKKFKSGAPPKKPIILRSCFSINRKKDARHNHVITLYTNQDSVSIAADSEEELDAWLGQLKLHMQTALPESEDSRRLYEHVWLVMVLPRSLGDSRIETGEYRICLTYRSIAIVKTGEGNNKIDFPLTSIRCCGHTGAFFFLAVGRSAITGPGDIWMLTEDAVIAENMHQVIKGAMHDPYNNPSEENVRERTHSMLYNRSFDGTTPCHPRSRCDSMPSRSRTSSEGSVQTVPNKLPPSSNCPHQLDGAGNICLHPITRPKSMYSTSLSSSCSQPFASPLFSPSSSESVESTTSVDECDGPHSYTPEMDHSGIGEEEDSYVHMGHGNTRTSGSSFYGRDHHHHHPQSSLDLPIHNRSIVHSLSKGLASPMSSSSNDGQCMSSPKDNYMEMASPSANFPTLSMLGSLSDRGSYMVVDHTQSQVNAGSSDNSGYLTMSSPGSSFPSWPPHTSSQVSSPPHSANHSRIPSLVDEYMSMGPGNVNEGFSFSTESSSRDPEGYIDMTPTQAIPLPCSPSDGDSFPEMSPGSSCSLTSGTPSSDHRFPDFIAEKGGSGSYGVYSEDDDSSMERPIRTNSVGSKPEQFRSRKNRLEVGPIEPGRVRAFSVGSRVGLRLAGGRTGYMTGTSSAAAAAAAASITEFSPSIKEKGKQVKSKSTSAPILGSSPISNSWSGTPGTFFRGFLQTRNQERNDLMEFDFSKNKSCDSITGDKEKKSSSIESIRRTLTGQRHRSNSKSSGNGKSSVFDSMKRDKKKSESENSGKGIKIPNRANYFEVDISPSPRPRRNTESNNGYLPMKPAMSLSQSSTSEYLDMNNKDSGSKQPFTDSYMNMSRSSDRIVSSLGPSHEGYVDMSQGKGIGPLAAGSSSSTPSNSSSFIGARVRKFSSTLIPMSSQDTCSQLDEYMPVDFRSNADSSSHSLDGEKTKKKEKKSTKKKSFKDSTRRKRSDPIAVTGKGDNEAVTQDGSSRKGTSPLSHWSTFLGRKNSSSTPPKTPLSPNGSPLPKSSRGTPSPFSSLTRSKNRDSKDAGKESASKESCGGPSPNSGFSSSCIEESSREAEESAISGVRVDASSSISAQTVPNSGEQINKSTNKRSSGVFESSSQVMDSKSDDRLESDSHSTQVSQQQQQSDCTSSDTGAYVNLLLGSSSSDKSPSVITEPKQRKVSTGSLSDYMNISPIATSRTESETQQHSLQPPSSSSHNYVNMCPGGRRTESSSHTSPRLTPPSGSTTTSSATSSPSPKSRKLGKDDHKRSPNLGYSGQREQNRRESKRLSSGASDDGEAESGYLLMTPGQPPPSPKPTSPRVVTRRPDIPPALLGGRPDPSLTANLERLNLVGPGGSSSSSVSERCRSHSGPGAPEGSAVGGEVRVKKQLSEPRVGSGGQGNSGRAASACSSPVSYSPPTSPTLGGSVSSVSSLSEGGLSSASSTCTVVNVGAVRRESGLTATGRLQQDTHSDSTSSASASSLSSSQQSSTTVSSGSGGDSGLNYVALDLGPARCEGIMPSPRASRRSTSSTSTHSSVVMAPQEAVVGEEDHSLSYAQIDFTKSEGLRTTSLSRDHRH